MENYSWKYITLRAAISPFSSLGVQVWAAGRASQHSVPMYALDVVTAHEVSAISERAWTSVGTSSQSWLDASLNVSVSLTRLPSSVGIAADSELLERSNPMVIAVSLPNSVGIDPVNLFVSRKR